MNIFQEARSLIIEEANKKVQKVMDKYSKYDEDPIIVNQQKERINGYNAGRELGHPMTGEMAGREAAAGALSRHDKTVSIGDVYTTKNLGSRLKNVGAPAAVIGTGVGALFGGPVGAAIGAGSGLALGAAVPGASYLVGKTMGSKQPKKDIYNKRKG